MMNTTHENKKSIKENAAMNKDDKIMPDQWKEILLKKKLSVSELFICAMMLAVECERLYQTLPDSASYKPVWTRGKFNRLRRQADISIV